MELPWKSEHPNAAWVQTLEAVDRELKADPTRTDAPSPKISAYPKS
jgi:hypothetical protein